MLQTFRTYCPSGLGWLVSAASATATSPMDELMSSASADRTRSRDGGSPGVGPDAPGRPAEASAERTDRSLGVPAERADDVSAQVLAVARSVLQDLDVEKVLERVLVAARDVTGARYAALGVLDESRTHLGRFLTLGIDVATRSADRAFADGSGRAWRTDP